MTVCQMVTTYQRGMVITLARLLNEQGLPVIPADIASITLNVYDEHSTNPASSLYTEDVDPLVAIFDTLQTTDPRWKIDDVGYNFLHQASGDATSEISRSRRFEYEMVPVSDVNSRIWVVSRVEVLDALSIPDLAP